MTAGRQTMTAIVQHEYGPAPEDVGEAAAAIRYMRDGHARGKLVITVLA
jgi:hypothetical protein